MEINDYRKTAIIVGALFIAAGEAVDWNRRQTISYEWTLSRARAADNGKAVTALEKINPLSTVA
jgi:hypothetical protein